MNCGEAQDLIASGPEASVSATDGAGLAAHLESCPACRRVQGETNRLLAALAALPGEAPVHAGLEARTLRRVHDLLDGERRRRPWRLLAQWLPAPALAVLAVVVVASWWPATPGPMPAPVAPVASRTPSDEGPGTRLARAGTPEEPRRAAPASEASLTEPPAELAGAIDMFLELPILEHMEKLQNFEVIYTTELEGEKGHNG